MNIRMFPIYKAKKNVTKEKQMKSVCVSGKNKKKPTQTQVLWKLENKLKT